MRCLDQDGLRPVALAWLSLKALVISREVIDQIAGDGEPRVGLCPRGPSEKGCERQTGSEGKMPQYFF